MRKSLTALLMASLLLTGCSGWSTSGANPKNWFGSSSEAPPPGAVAIDPANPLVPKQSNLFRRPEADDASVPIDVITELKVERTPTGAIILVTGTGTRQGAYDAQLRLDPVGEDGPKGALSYTFRVTYPKNATNVGSDLSRTVQAAVSLTTQELTGIRSIKVSGAQNTRETRRR